MADEPTEEAVPQKPQGKPTASFWPFGQHQYVDYIIYLQEKTLAAIDDLNAIVQTVASQQAAVDQAVNDLVAAVAANSSATNDPAIQAAVSTLQGVSTAQQADAAQDPGAPPAPAPPAP